MFSNTRPSSLEDVNTGKSVRGRKMWRHCMVGGKNLGSKNVENEKRMKKGEELHRGENMWSLKLCIAEIA